MSTHTPLAPIEECDPSKKKVVSFRVSQLKYLPLRGVCLIPVWTIGSPLGHMKTTFYGLLNMPVVRLNLSKGVHASRNRTTRVTIWLLSTISIKKELLR